MRKLFHKPTWILLVSLMLVTLVPALPLFRVGSSPTVHATGIQTGPIISHVTRHPKTHPHHSGSGANRTHLPTLSMLSTLTKQTQHASANATHPLGALVSANANPRNTTTLFFDNFESGAPGWTTVGDNLTTPYYPTGHDFWNLVQNPNLLSVPSSVNPTLVSYPDAAGMLPSAYSGTHAWWYGDNPAVDTPNPSGASITYMGNQSDWPGESNGDGGTSNGPNSASLISPTIDLTSAPNAVLSFATWWEIESVNPTHFDMMYVDVSTNGGTSWTSAGVLNPTNNPAGGADPYPYTNNGLDAPASWQVASVDLSSYVGSQVQVRFRFDSIDQFDNGFRGWFVDDVGVYSATAGSPIVSTISPDNGVVGNTVTISGSGFGAQQNGSTVSFNGIAANVQSWSDTSITATVPTGATSGPLIVTVNSVQSFAVNFTVNASISLSLPSAQPQTVDSVSGQGFAANEPITLYLNGVNGTQLATATSDSNGNLSATNITVPSLPASNYLVLAEGQNSHVTAATTLSIIPGLSSSVSKVKTSQTINLSGLGFAPYDSVQVQLDNNSSAIGFLSCDSNGNCSGSATMPTSSVVQGLHLLVGNSSSGLIAEAPVNFTPGISLTIPFGSQSHATIGKNTAKKTKNSSASSSIVSGGPGTSLILTGTSFTANETVQVFWNTSLLEGSPITDANGNLNFAFNAPTSVAPGKYPVTVVRTQHTPSPVSTKFEVLAPKMTSTGGIHGGQSVSVQLSGFQAHENVTINWNANGGQQLAIIGVDDAGAVSYSFTPPAAPLGMYTLTAIGDTSGLQATSSLNVGPGIQLSPNSANPGGTITVNGGGYTAGETINVYFQTTANGEVSTTADAAGSFSVSLTIPVSYKQTRTYFVHAVSTSGLDKSSAQFFYVTPYFYSYYYYLDYGSQTTLYGQGYASNEVVNLYWDYKQAGQVKIGTATAASDGTFTTVVTVPSDPNLGSVNIAAIGATSKLKYIGSVYEFAALVLSPASGPAGTKVHVSGGGFDSTEVVTVSYQSTSLGTATTDTSGFFRFTFTVPTTTSLSYTTVSASGGTSGIFVSATFIVTPILKISPKTGPSGTSITLNGKNFTASNSASLYWYDPSTGSYSYFGSVNTSSMGTIKTTITAPSGLVSGNTYYVQAYDGYTSILAQAAFIAQ